MLNWKKIAVNIKARPVGLNSSTWRVCKFYPYIQFPSLLIKKKTLFISLRTITDISYVTLFYHFKRDSSYKKNFPENKCLEINLT